MRGHKGGRGNEKEERTLLGTSMDTRVVGGEVEVRGEAEVGRKEDSEGAALIYIMLTMPHK